MTKNYVHATENPLTPAHEDYLKAIYLLEANGEPVSNSALAQHMGFAPASATNMVKKLAELNLVTHEPYRGMELTDLGRQVALEVLRHHRLIELFLHETLDMSWDRVHEEADKLEHVISEAMEDAMAAVLGNPTVDPHGDPIPSKEGHVDKTPGSPLSIAAIGEPLRLVRVLTQDPDRLCYLGSLGLYPDAEVVLRERAPFNGPLLVEVNGKPHALAFEMGEYLQVVVKERRPIKI
jgi:DtxR family Mn-dependent transcriptional regulator